MEHVTAEILCYGNELLIGQTVNTNASWLGKELTELGVVVTRVTTLPDDLASIEAGFQEAIERAPSIVISTGGLGPTWDDQTLVGLARAVGEEVVRNTEAYELILASYAKRGLTMNPAAAKMADFPTNASPLSNAEGTAPGTLYDTSRTKVYCLPGVPREMRDIFYKHTRPQVAGQAAMTGVKFHQTKFQVEKLRESVLAGVTSQFTQVHPTVYIKSHPHTGEGSKGVILIHLTARGDEKVGQLVKQVALELEQELTKIGGLIHPTED